MQIPSNILKLAKKEIQYNVCQFRHISIITHKSKILSFGMNRIKTHTKAMKFTKNWFQIHSELDAILKFKRKTNINLSSCTLYNIRFLKEGNIGISYPCQSCLKLIISENFKNVYFSTNLGDFCKLI